MATYSLERVCVIHFEGKAGELKNLTQERLAKIIERRKQWLSLPYSESYTTFTEVAKKSFDYIDESEYLDPTDISPTCAYHPACYRNFTDLTKIERATKAGQKRLADKSIEEDDTRSPKREKVSRSTRQSFNELVAGRPSRSSDILPQICPICKRHGPIYFTDKVNSTIYSTLFS